MARKFPNGIDLQNQKAVGAADGTAATDLVTKQQLDGAVVGLAWKAPVRAATTTTGTLSTAYANGSAIDGVTLATNDRILIKDQTTATENGIYTVNSTGVPTRATDADSTSELNGAAVYITTGTTNADKAYTQTTDSPTISSSSIVWAQFGGGTLPTAGAGLTLTGSTLDVGNTGGSGITVNANDIAIDHSVVPKLFSIATHAATTSIAITHSLGTTATTEAVFITATGEEIYPDIFHTSTTVTTFVFGVAPTLNTLTFVIHG